MGYESVTVIGRTRHGLRYAVVDMRAAHLTNWRVTLVCSPAVLDRIRQVCWSANHGFSTHGNDRAGQAYHDDLQRMAVRFPQRCSAAGSTGKRRVALSRAWTRLRESLAARRPHR